MGLIKITPDKEKAKSMLRMVETTEKMIETLDTERFASNITKEYYEVIRELISILLLLDGYKVYGEGSHKSLIEYLEDKYKQFLRQEIEFIDDLRNIRNRISYDGFFVQKGYLIKKTESIKRIIATLKELIENKITP
jgi:hypothetical protein